VVETPLPPSFIKDKEAAPSPVKEVYSFSGSGYVSPDAHETGTRVPVTVLPLGQDSAPEPLSLASQALQRQALRLLFESNYLFIISLSEEITGLFQSYC
jgi:hypothetical protein